MQKTKGDKFKNIYNLNLLMNHFHNKRPKVVQHIYKIQHICHQVLQKTWKLIIKQIIIIHNNGKMYRFYLHKHLDLRT